MLSGRVERPPAASVSGAAVKHSLSLGCGHAHEFRSLRKPRLDSLFIVCRMLLNIIVRRWTGLLWVAQHSNRVLADVMAVHRGGAQYLIKKLNSWALVGAARVCP